MNFTSKLTRDLATCFALRGVVFIDEQGVPENQQMDKKGKAATARLSQLRRYKAPGFGANGPVYDDAGVDHRDMVRAL